MAIFDSYPIAVSSLRPDQQAIADHPARFKVVACGRRWGKTTLGLAIASKVAHAGKLVWWVAPTYGLAFHPWRLIKQAQAGQWERKLEVEHYIELEGGGSLTVKSADDPDSLRGVGLDLVVIDEAAIVSEEAWVAALRPALSDRKGNALIISTPRGRNWFYHAFRRGNDPLNPDWQSWSYPTAANTLIDAQEIDEAQGLLPERIFKQEYLAEFLPDGGEVFRRVRDSATAQPGDHPIPGHTYLMGVDFGRHHDFTALAVIDETAGAMVTLERFSGVDWEMQRGRIAALARRWNVEAVLAEANAMGEPNIEALAREGVPISGFVTTAHSKQPLIESLVKAIESGEIALLADDVLLGELESYRYEVMQFSGRSRYGPPSGLHDDTVIALALAWRLAVTPGVSLGVAEV